MPENYVITLDDYIAAQQKFPQVADRLGQADIQSAIEKIAKEYGADPSALAYVVEFAVLKKEMAAYLPKMLAENMSLDACAALGASKDVAEKIFSMPKTGLAEPKKYISLWETEKISPMPLSQALETLAQRIGGKADAAKLRAVMETRLRDVRGEAETFQTLKNAKEKGGLGFAPAEAERIMKQLKLYFGKVGFPNTAQEVPSVKPAASGAGRGVSAEAARAEDSAEIGKAAKKIVVSSASVAKTFEENLSEAVKSVISQTNIRFANPILQSRYESVISAYLRDVRDQSETKETLMRGDKLGGLGLGSEQAERVLQVASGVIANSLDKYKKQEEARRQGFLKEQAEKEALRREERERREREEREKLYVRVTGVAPTIRSVKKPTALSQQPGATAVQQQPAVSQIPNSEISRRSGIPPFPLNKSKEAAGQIPATKTKMEEVKFTSRARGPVEELKEMSLAEFRRLSKDAKVATEKIKDKLELLEEEDFTKKVAGIKAWQESEVNTAYLGLLRESLMKGLAIDAVIAESIGKSAPTLTKDEFTAIMELNRSLRF